MKNKTNENQRKGKERKENNESKKEKKKKESYIKRRLDKYMKVSTLSFCHMCHN